MIAIQKVIYRLPEIEDLHYWACDAGCEDVKPTLHKHAFRQSWNASGDLIDQHSECYYTCQHGHVLSVIDADTGEVLLLPEEHYTEQVNKFNWDLETVKAARKMIHDFKAQFRVNSLVEFDDFSGAIETILPTGEKLRFTEAYINEIEAILSTGKSMLNK